MKRTQADITKVVIYTNPQGRDGWLVDMLYNDGKAVELQIDVTDESDMLVRTVNAIKRQLEGNE